MICERCKTVIKTIGPFVRSHNCSVAFKAPGVERALSSVGEVRAGADAATQWARTDYGEFYPKSVSVYAAVKIRADALLRPPLRVYNGDPSDSAKLTEVNRDHPLKKLLTKVNPWWTFGDLLFGVSVYLDLWGSAFIRMERDDNTGLPTKLWLLRPDKMKIIPDSKDYISHFELQVDQRAGIKYKPEEIVWLRAFNPLEEFAGLSPIAPLKLSLDMAHEALKHNRNVFKNGILTDVFIALEGMAVDEEIDAFNRRIKERYAGTDKAHEPMILSGVREIKNLGLSSREMEFIATLRWSLEDVARVYGVPKPLLSDLERATYSNIRAVEVIFWRNTIVPYMKFIESELNEMLVSHFNEIMGQELFVEFDLSEIEALKTDDVAATAGDRADVRAGILTINEVRGSRGLEAVAWGDVYWIPGSWAPVDSDEPPPQADPVPRPDDEGGTPEISEAYRNLSAYRRYKPTEIDDNTLEKLKKSHIDLLDRFTKQFKQINERLFKTQTLDVSNTIIELGEKVTLDKIFNVESWSTLFMSMGKPLFNDIILQSVYEQKKILGLATAFDASKSEIQDWIEDRINLWAKDMNLETYRLLEQELDGREASSFGEGVEKVFKFSGLVRSSRIAELEVQSASNVGLQFFYEQLGVLKKRWVGCEDSHKIDGEIALVKGDFYLEGRPLLHPGQIFGVYANNPYCSCTISPVFQDANKKVK